MSGILSLNDYSRRRRERFRRVLQCFQFADFKGKRVLEIAGNDSEVAEYFLSLGAESVTIINIDPVFADGEISPGISFKCADARQLRDDLGEGPFDIIFGIAILEHLNDMERALADCMRALAPGGLLFLHGQPLWSSSIGHHVWVIGREMNYRFTDASNPIPAHGHLLLGERGLSADLLGRGLSPAHVEAILHYVYHSQDINRYGYRRTLRAFESSGLNLADVAVFRENVPADRLALLRGVDGLEDHSALGMHVASFLGAGARLRGYFEAGVKAYEIAPNRAEWALCSAEVLLSQSRLSEAEKRMRTAIDLDGNLVRAHERLAEILERKGDVTEARRIMESAIRRWPHDRALTNRAAMVLPAMSGEALSARS